MNEIEIKLSITEMRQELNKFFIEEIRKQLSFSEKEIRAQLNQFLERKSFSSRESQYESALDWAIEDGLRRGVQSALEELSFAELVKARVVELLSDKEFLTELAREKVKKSMGL